MTEPPRKDPEPGKTSIADAIVGLAIAAGFVAVGAYMLDLHGHTCDRCGRRWRHFGAFNLGDEKSHTCSRCGDVQWWKCGTPPVLRGVPAPASSFESSPATSGAMIDPVLQASPRDYAPAISRAGARTPLGAAVSTALAAPVRRDP